MDLTTIPSPCFVLDEQAFTDNLAKLHAVQTRSGVRIIPALKGFAAWKSFEPIQKLFSGASASSVNEARLAFEKLGTKAHVYAPAYDEKTLKELYPFTHRLSFNSPSQWDAFAAEAIKENISCGVRVNPGFSPVKTAQYNPCTPGSRLGVDIEKLPDPLPQGMEGLHIHNLCESDHTALENTLAILEEKIPKQLRQIKWLNLGGGHLMTSKDYDTDRAIAVLKKFKEKYVTEIILEPGAAFVWRAGTLVAKVLDIVENAAVHTAILNISFAAHLPDCLEMPYLPDIRGAEQNGGKYRYRLGGTTCLAGDFIGDYGFQDPLATGDTLVFEDMMHYTAVKSTFFNGVKHPSLGLWTKNGHFELWKVFTYEDYRDRLN